MKNLIKKINIIYYTNMFISSIFTLSSVLLGYSIILYIFVFLMLLTSNNLNFFETLLSIPLFIHLNIIFFIILSFFLDFLDKKQLNLLKKINFKEIKNFKIKGTILEKYIKKIDIEKLIENKVDISEYYGNKNWIFKHINNYTDSDELELSLNSFLNEELITYLEDVDENIKLTKLSKLLLVIDKKNKEDYYLSIIKLFPDTNNSTINSIKYKYSLLKEKKIEEKSIIINI